MTRTALVKKMIETLERLKDNCGAELIKAEFEAEGSRKDELIMLRDLVNAADLKFVVKIGGCEAVHDIDQCKLFGVTGVIAPMVETAFALDKFKRAFCKIFGYPDGIERIINAETKTCFQNFDEILEHGKGFLTGITVGRSDLSASLGISKNDIDSEKISSMTRTFCMKAKAVGLVTTVGGYIGIESIPFLVSMKPYIDCFETRKVVMRASDDEHVLKNAIAEALKFELLYLHFKSEYYLNMSTEDQARIERLTHQLKSTDNA